jgi:hypothetical protein
MSSSNPREESFVYDITTGCRTVPPGLLASRCDRVYIELLKLDTRGMSVQAVDGAPNHAVFKIEFNRKN